MIATRAESVQQRIDALRRTAPDIDAAAAVCVDGLMIACSLPDDLEEARLSAMSAAMLALGERIADELGRGALDQLFIKGENGFVLMVAVNDRAALTVLANEEAKLGLALLDMQRTARELRELV